MTDSARTGWTDYFGEAEGNRDAVASLGHVRTVDQNGGQSLRVIGAHRLVLAFDPDTDTPIFAHRDHAPAHDRHSTASRKGVQQVATAEEKIAEALNNWRRSTRSRSCRHDPQKSGTKIDSECTTSTRPSGD